MIKGIRILKYLLLSGLIITIASCNEKFKKYAEEEISKIEEYLAKNSSLNFDLKTSGLYFLELEAGDGLQANTHDTAYVFYTLKLLDGTELDSNVGTVDTLIFPVNEGYLITGFDEGVTYMKEGGKAIFLIPSSLAYGTTGDYYGTIAGYTPLLFDVVLSHVKQGPGDK